MKIENETMKRQYKEECVRAEICFIIEKLHKLGKGAVRITTTVAASYTKDSQY